MYTTEIDSGRTAWPTQIDAVLWTERKLNNFLALVVYQNLFSVYSTRYFPNVLASTLRFESRQQSTALVVERREPRFACVRCARRRSVSAACMIFAVKGNPLHIVGWDAYHRLSPSLFLGREDGVETRPGEHCLQWTGGLRRAVGVYVRSRSTSLYLLPVTGERRQLAISSSLKSHALLWSKG